jgi:LAO/AO transport system kinase
MGHKKKEISAIKVREGVYQPPSINPGLLKGTTLKKRKIYSVDEYVSGIIEGDRTILSQAITLAESSLPEHYDISQEIIESCLSHSAGSIRIGVTGVPGAGKSTFIESFGLHVIDSGRKLAVLAVDPSSKRTKGSILGDKTRMEKLSMNPDVFIRPSPAAGTLGGVARKTRETIILCEAGGFNTILVETVGVGQSETAVHSMVDFFLLLMLAGAGDEMQGIKRGIIELADTIAITKADGTNKLAAEGAKVMYQNALHLFPLNRSGWKADVLTCSAFENTGINEIWNKVLEYEEYTKHNNYFYTNRNEQTEVMMNDTISEFLSNSFYNDAAVKSMKPGIEKLLKEEKITSYKAAVILIDKYLKRQP